MTRSIGFVCLGPWESTYCLRARSLGRELRKLGWKVCYLIRHRDYRGEPDDAIEFLPETAWAQASTIRGVVKRRGLEWLHFLNPNVRAVLLALRASTRIVGDWEDWNFLGHRGWKRVAYEWSSFHLLRRVSIPLACSQALCEEFKRLGRSDAVFLPYAVDPIELPLHRGDDAPPTAVFMGNFYRSWDHDILFDAALQLARRGVFPRIELIGKGEDFERCQEFCRTNRLENIEFAGYLPEEVMSQRLQRAHVLLFPLRKKQLNEFRCPYKVLQYARAKRPILTCRVGEVPYFLGEKAFYAEPTAESFAAQLERIMEQPRIQEVDYGIESHSWQRRAAVLDEALRGFRP